MGSFEDYARWVSRMLQSRGIEPRFVAENFEQLAAALQPDLTDQESAIVTAVLDAGRAVCLSAPAADAATDIATEGNPAQVLFLQMILAGKRKEALHIVQEALHAGQALLDVYVEILQESLYLTGRLWETNQITVAEEHMATAIVQYVLAQQYARLPPAASIRGNIVVTGIQGELHQVGANLVADVLDADGWDVRFLGTNLPQAAILAAIDAHRADILGISATMLFSLPQVKALMAAVRARYGPHRPRIVLGGGAFRGLPNLATDLGADGSTTDVRDVSALMQAVLAAEPRP